jgi:hypothetical protein
VLDLAAAIRAANLTQEQWAQSQGFTPGYVTKLIKQQSIVIDGVVYRPTKYRVKGNGKA